MVKILPQGHKGDKDSTSFAQESKNRLTVRAFCDTMESSREGVFFYEIRSL
jgi:hypothetical protein